MITEQYKDKVYFSQLLRTDYPLIPQHYYKYNFLST